MQRVLALIILALSLPLWPLLFIAIKLDSKGPFIFKQKRVGKNKKLFTLYKIRTMVVNAEKIKKKYKSLNQGVGPIFKIHNDPRFTKVGKFISHTYLDELPQLFNVAKGEMAFVGPRPLLVSDIANTPKKYHSRLSILPGLTSTWNIKGRYRLSFEEWMKLDVEYVKRKSAWIDFKILLATLLLVIRAAATELNK